MARTEQEIYDSLIDAKDADSFLSTVLTSLSKTSFYQALFRLYAFVASIFEQEFDSFTENTETLLDTKQIHNSDWWRRVSLAFQLGDPLVRQDNGNLGYETVDEEKQIIQRAAVLSETTGSIILKVAKLDSGSPVPLASSELSAFDSYVNDIVPAGIGYSIVSVNGDEVRISLNVEIDSQIINVDDGTLLSDGTTKPVENAINDYFGVFQNDEFGGTFFANNLISNILAASGVVNATYVFLEKKASNEGSFTDILALSGKKFLTFSGYVRLEVGFDLSANINYTAS